MQALFGTCRWWLGTRFITMSILQGMCMPCGKANGLQLVVGIQNLHIGYEDSHG